MGPEHADTISQSTVPPRRPHLRLIASDARPVRTPSAMNESTLNANMKAALAGDARAYATFLADVASVLRPYFARRLFSGPDQAEDLVQDVLIAIHTKRATYDPALPVTAWVYAIARYKLIDHLRRVRRRGVQIPSDDIADLFPAPETDEGAAGADIERLLEYLPAKQRTVIRLVRLEQLSVREVAERTGYSESDVKVSVHRGLKKLEDLVRKDV